MVKQVRRIVALWIVALAISACGALEVGIEQVAPAANAQPVNWQATAESLQAEATRQSSDAGVVQEGPTPTPTLVPAEIPTIVPPAATPAMVAYVTGGDIWVKRLPDGEAQRLTKDGLNQSPSWSGNGEWIAFLKKPDYPELWVMRRDGSDAQQIGTAAGQNAYAWSPTNDTLALADGGSVEFYSFGEGGQATLTAETDIEPAEDNPRIDKIAWDEGGEQIALTIMAQGNDGALTKNPKDGLWRVDVATNTPEQMLVSEVPEKGQFILYGWGGSYILYWQGPILSASILADGVPLYRVPAPGGNNLLAESVLVQDNLVAPQPNGVAQVSIVEGSGREMWQNKQLHVVGTEREIDRTISSAGQAVSSPAWSPSGTSIAYVAMPNVDGVGGGEEAQQALQQRQLWIAGPGDTEPMPQRLRVLERIEAPQWIDDETLLVVVMAADGQVSLEMVDRVGNSLGTVAEEITPTPDWFGYYGNIDWSTYFALWRPPYVPVSTINAMASLTPTPMADILITKGRPLATMLEGLTPTLTKEQAVTLWGEPDVTTGSGLIIYQYQVEDGLSLWLAFPGDGPLTYAQLQTPNGRRFVLSPAEEASSPTPVLEPTVTAPISPIATSTPKS